jgi:hypothetical protein
MFGALGVGCSRNSQPEPHEATGTTASAIINGVNDTIGFEPNAVVALEGADGKVACSGVLITPLVVLTAKACVSEERAGRRPTIRVGSNYDTATAYRAERDAVLHEASSGRAADLALVFLDPARPVLEEAIIRRFAVAAPPPDTDGDGTSFDYNNMGVAGWSPLGADGTPRPGSAGVRQQATRGVMRFVSDDAGILWVRDVRNLDGALAEGDLGGPLFQVLPDGRREVLGIATRHGVTPASAPSVCPRGAARCDVWEDVTLQPISSWVKRHLEIRSSQRTARWFAAHSRPTRNENGFFIPDWWYGEVDYTGPCDTARDKDCDHWFDTAEDGSPRDNCVGWWNPDQADGDDDGIGSVCDHCPTLDEGGAKPTSPAWQNRSEPVVGPSKRYPEPHESMFGRYPGDKCRTLPTAKVTHLANVRETDPNTDRWVYGEGGFQPVEANPIFELRPQALGGGTQLGTVRLMSCDCDLPSVKDCVEIRVDYCLMSDRAQVTNPRAGWRAMTLADGTREPAARLGTLSSDGLIESEFRDEVQSGGTAQARVAWKYWQDLRATLPSVKASSDDQLVFRGVVSSWVKNYAPAASGRPTRDLVTDPENALERVTFTRVDIVETRRPAVHTGPIPQLDDWYFKVEPVDPYCPMCGFGDIVLLPRPDIFINPGSPIFRDPIIRLVGGETRFASTLLGIDTLHALSAPNTQIIRAGDALGAHGTSTLYGAAVNLESSRITGLLSSAADGTMRTLSADIPLGGETTLVWSPFAPSGQELPNAPSFFGSDVTTASALPHVMAVSATRGVLYDFGTSWAAGSANAVTTTDLRSGQQKHYGLQGTPLGTVVAAAYRSTDELLYVIDVANVNGATMARLARLDARFRARIVASWPLAKATSLALTANAGGELTVTVSHPNTYAVVHGKVVFEDFSGPTFEPIAVGRGAGTAMLPAAVRGTDVALTWLSARGPENRTAKVGVGVVDAAFEWLDVSRAAEVF